MDKSNNFGSIRLGLASLVILSHSPQLIDGDNSREILVNLFGTISFGELAVDGFFIVSGFLIAKSYLGSTLISFAVKRVARIYPGFLVCFALCAFLLAPIIVGAEALAPGRISMGLLEALQLKPPIAAGQFPDVARPSLNGALWTISYEFRCYILAALCGVVGLYGAWGRWVFAIISTLLLIVNAPGLTSLLHLPVPPMLSSHAAAVRLTGMFFAGTCFFLFRHRLQFPLWAGPMSLVLLAIGLTSAMFAEFAVATFGVYLVFWVAFGLPVFRLEAFTRKQDLSYGIYLYAWPVQNALIHWFGIGNHLLLSALTLAITVPIAFLSWNCVERPSLNLARRSRWAGGKAVTRLQP